ncbi:MAG: glycosyltransferase [Candidatus Babeliales bacterium]
MNIINFFKKNLSFNSDFQNRVVTLYPENKNSAKRALISYLKAPALWNKKDERFNGHSNNWECREIINIFLQKNYIVDAINYSDKFVPDKKYDVVLDIHQNLQNFMPYLDSSCKKILHITGSYPRFQNEAEIKRIEELEKRRDMYCSPRRIDSYLELFDRSLKFADYCSLIGNDFVLNTFPKKYKDKITKVTVSASKLEYIKSKESYVSEKREFLWFFGSGAVHKGLDLVLEVFSKNKNLVLNVVGAVEKEKDFWNIYQKELTEFENIKYHGYLEPNSEKFLKILKNLFAFIAPSCSEGISPSVATCLQLGLFPIISRNTGMNLPENCGIYLENCSMEEIEKSIFKAFNLDEYGLKNQIAQCQSYALGEFSRENFSKNMKNFINKVVGE